MSIGSILGISNSGIPFTSDGRSFSILVIIHPFKSGSLLWQTCKISANGKKHVQNEKKIVIEYDIDNFYSKNNEVKCLFECY